MINIPVSTLVLFSLTDCDVIKGQQPIHYNIELNGREGRPVWYLYVMKGHTSEDILIAKNYLSSKYGAKIIRIRKTKLILN